MSDAATLRVGAALLAQGRAVHQASIGLAVAACVLAPVPLVAIPPLGFLVLETWLAVRVGLDARLLEALADGLEPRALDGGLVGARLVRATVDRPVPARVAGSVTLFRAQVASAVTLWLYVVVEALL